MGLVKGIPTTYGMGSFYGFSGSKLLGFLPLYLIFIIALIGWILLGTRHAGVVLSFGRLVISVFRNMRGINWIFWGLSIILFGFCALLNIRTFFLTEYPLIWLFGHIALLGVLFMNGTGRVSLLFSMLITFSVYGLFLWLVFYLPSINNYPLTLAWSETSHYYYASLIFSRSLYSQRVPLSFLNPSRYLLLSLPFIVSSIPLWLHRLWESLLWIGMTYASALALTNRIKPENKSLWLILTAWFFLFCFQGTVYYQLMLVILIVMLGFKKDRLWYSLGFVAVASLWAGINRVNWFPVAGMLAVTLYVLEVHYENKSFWEYWRWPIIAVILGMILAFGSNAVYQAVSGQPSEFFTMSFRMPLLWYRLLPNKAFGLGVIPSTVIASLPAWIVVLWRILPRLGQWHTLRLLALLSIVVSLMIVGFIVSARIGGGNNIHNLDSYLVILGVITAYVAFDKFLPDEKVNRNVRDIPYYYFTLAILIPITFAVSALHPFPQLNHQQAWEDIQQVQTFISDAQEANGEILFIHQRHLIVFDMVGDVELVYEYEKVELMEMAMANNQDYLKQFWEDLKNHRFDLIIMEPIVIIFRPSTGYFAEENNAWVEHVSTRLLQSYDVIAEMIESNMIVLAPKTGN